MNLTVTSPSGVGFGASYDLNPNDEITIYETHTVGYASGIIENKPMNSEFLNCLELTKDSVPIKIDIHNASAWTPENIADTLAMYTRQSSKTLQAIGLDTLSSRQFYNLLTIYIFLVIEKFGQIAYFCYMPTVLAIFRWRLFFYSNEGSEPIHIHEEKGDMECIF